MDKRYTPVYDLVYQLRSVTYKGIIYEINLADKCIYSYMYYRYIFFKTNGSEYYDNQEEISKHLGVSTKTLMRSIKKLVNLDLVVIDRKGRSNNYKVNWIEDVNLIINDKSIDF